ncbi:MAG: hypothetical protein II059_04680 [Clostridia bacterium]|nr:hypothetical protein [Clostridia bacterium]
MSRSCETPLKRAADGESAAERACIEWTSEGEQKCISIQSMQDGLISVNMVGVW